MNTINFKELNNSEKTWYFEKGQKGLFRNVGNPYTTKLRTGKNILVDKSLHINKDCYLSLEEVIELEKCYVVTKAKILLGKNFTKESLSAIKSERERMFAIPSTVKLFNCKKNGITFGVKTYQMKCDRPSHFSNNIFFDCYMFDGKTYFYVEAPVGTKKNHDLIADKLLKISDFSKAYFDEFEELV